jgi:hypothetical protein
MVASQRNPHMIPELRTLADTAARKFHREQR